MNKFSQRGLSLSALMMWGIVIALVSILGMRVVPSAIEYYKLKQNIEKTVAQSNANSTVADVRKTFDRFAQVDYLEFNAQELDITKENGQIIISFSYEKKLPLFGNVSLLIDYSASTAGAAKD